MKHEQVKHTYSNSTKICCVNVYAAGRWVWEADVQRAIPQYVSMVWCLIKHVAQM